MTELLRSYLFAWLFLLGITLGAMANLMVHSLTGGRWGEAMRPPLLAAARLMPWVALLFLPILLGMARLYPFATEPGHWLNTPFVAARSFAYLVIWVVLAAGYLRADRATLAPAAGGSRRAQAWSAAGLIIYALTMSLAAFDWIVALTPHWYSSGFGLVVGVGQMLSGMAFAVTVAAFFPRAAEDDATRLRFHDLGNLLLMYVLTWAYLAYTQFLVIWSENLPHEIHWYVPRVQTGWAALGFFLVAFHFFLPLLLLLSRSAKRAPALLGSLAAALLLAHLADVFWLVMPAFRPDGFAIGWSDPIALAVLGALWLFLWRRALAHPYRTLAAAQVAHG
jgi:hypothetical protein